MGIGIRASAALEAEQNSWWKDALKRRQRIEALEAALQFIADGYDNQDINHVDYRVKVYQVARDALDKDAEK